MCPSDDTFDKNKKNLDVCTGLNSKDRKSTRDKANISNPKVNRGCAPLTANRISADYVKISVGLSTPYIPLGVYHTGIQRYDHSDLYYFETFYKEHDQKTWGCNDMESLSTLLALCEGRLPFTGGFPSQRAS